MTVDSASGDVTRFGEPYNSAVTDDKLKTTEIKVWSKGPDRAQSLGSQALSGKGTGGPERRPVRPGSYTAAGFMLEPALARYVMAGLVKAGMTTIDST